MTYRIRQEEHKRRLEIVMPIIFVIGINACYVAYSYYFEGVVLWMAAKKAFDIEPCHCDVVESSFDFLVSSGWEIGKQSAEQTAGYFGKMIYT